MDQWQLDMEQAVTTVDELERLIHLSPEETEGVAVATRQFRMRLTRHIVSLMDPDDPFDPIKKQFLPSGRETRSDPTQFEDVTRDLTYSPVEGLVHKYPTKALLFPSSSCGSFCRFCFRRHLVGQSDNMLGQREIEAALKYVRETPQLDEVILSGGDPLTCTDEVLEWIISGLRAIPHIRVLRIHTRLPINCPSRITDRFVQMVRKYQPIYMVVHTNHAKEISEPTRQAFALLVNNGVPCLSQTALLHGVNDSEEALKDLWTTLIYNRVKPYYLFHTDPLAGLGHFRVPIPRGVEIMKNLYDRISGLAYPMYCLNVPGGYGHVLLGYPYLRRVGDGRYSIETYDGQQVEIEYPDSDE